MEALVIDINDIDKFPLLNKEKDSYWVPVNNTVGGEYWLSLEAEDDIKAASIAYTIGDITILEPTEEI